MIKLLNEAKSARYGFPVRMNAEDIRRALGIKGKLPEEGVDKRTIQGVEVYVKSLRQCREDDGNRSRKPHRIIALCDCGVEVPFGRIHQHKCRKADQ